MRCIDSKAFRCAMVEADIKTIGELEEKSGVNRNSISDYVNLKQTPSYDSIVRISEALELDTEGIGRVFFGGNLA